jgi:hypothetical protein
MVGAEPMLKISWMLRAVDFEVRYTNTYSAFYLKFKQIGNLVSLFILCCRELSPQMGGTVLRDPITLKTSVEQKDAMFG